MTRVKNMDRGPAYLRPPARAHKIGLTVRQPRRLPIWHRRQHGPRHSIARKRSRTRRLRSPEMTTRWFVCFAVGFLAATGTASAKRKDDSVVIVNYDSNPSGNANKNDFGVTNSIGWKFRRVRRGPLRVGARSDPARPAVRGE
jgi:hypothetical protein